MTDSRKRTSAGHPDREAAGGTVRLTASLCVKRPATARRIGDRQAEAASSTRSSEGEFVVVWA